MDCAAAASAESMSTPSVQSTASTSLERARLRLLCRLCGSRGSQMILFRLSVASFDSSAGALHCSTPLHSSLRSTRISRTEVRHSLLAPARLADVAAPYSSAAAHRLCARLARPARSSPPPHSPSLSPPLPPPPPQTPPPPSATSLRNPPTLSPPPSPPPPPPPVPFLDPPPPPAPSPPSPPAPSCQVRQRRLHLPHPHLPLLRVLPPPRWATPG